MWAIIHCFKITQKTLKVFDVSDKQGHCSGTCAHTVNRRAPIKQPLNTYNQRLQKWCWDSCPPAPEWLSSDCSFQLLLGSACQPVGEAEDAYHLYSLRPPLLILTKSPHQWKVVINKSNSPNNHSSPPHTHTHTPSPASRPTEIGEGPQLTAEISISGPGGCGEEEGTLCL